MVGFGEVGEFEIDGEGFGDAVGVFDGQAADDFAGAGHQALVEFRFAAVGELFATFDEQVAQLLDHVEEGCPFLLDEDAPEQNSERTDVAAQRNLFRGIGSVGGELGETVGLSAFAPERNVGHGIF